MYYGSYDCRDCDILLDIMLDIMTDAVIDIMVVNRGGRSATWLGPPALENLGGGVNGHQGPVQDWITVQ